MTFLVLCFAFSLGCQIASLAWLARESLRARRLEEERDQWVEHALRHGCLDARVQTARENRRKGA